MKDTIIQYRYHGRFISAGRASQLSHLHNASKYVSTSISYKVDSAVASKMAESGQWKESARPVRERPAPPAEIPRPIPAPAELPPEAPSEEEYYPEAPTYEREPFEATPFEPAYDYEKAGFDSPWTDDSLFYDDEWEAMDWDGDIADQDVETYV